MKCIPCRVSYEGFRYEIKSDGRVFGQEHARRNERSDAEYNDEVIDASMRQIVRDEAARQRRNRNARERSEGLRDLGLVKTPYGWE